MHGKSTGQKFSINPELVRQRVFERFYGTEDRTLPECISRAVGETVGGNHLQAALEVCQGSLRRLRQNGQKSWIDEKSANLAEARALEIWAKRAGLFILESEFNKPWEKGGKRGESEHQVYFDEKLQRWWKRNTLNFHNGTISSYLERLTAQIYLFPSLGPKLEGFTTFQGELMPVISQADIVGLCPGDEKVRESLIQRGFVEIYETGQGMAKAQQLAMHAGLKTRILGEQKRIGFYCEPLGLWLEDVHDENAKIAKGDVGVFDPVLFFVGELLRG
ncbi:MAG: hypothetical protein EBV83_08105 [Verrucomicrobia bacterium]|nr:hypothetical protein [Verrucomicrobiota bacterium]